MQLDFNKNNGLIPVIIQDQISLQVLMLGYMNKEALEKTQETNLVTFYSRSKKRLWTKGESSGNYLALKEIKKDCDSDTLLILALPQGPTCHTGTTSCFGPKENKGFMYELENTIQARIKEDSENSYTAQLYKSGIAKVAQKVGEEAVELVIEAMDNNPVNFINEAADLFYHYLLLLQSKNEKLSDVEEILKLRAIKN